MTNVNEKVEVNEKNVHEDNFKNEINYAPLVNVYENQDNFVLIANMPGISKENVKLKMEDHVLTIIGKINYEEAINKKYVLNESEIGNYLRRFKISGNIDESKIDAKYENGQLIVNLPKHDRIKPRTININ